jgi:hypothetical protein
MNLTNAKQGFLCVSLNKEHRRKLEEVAHLARTVSFRFNRKRRVPPGETLWAVVPDIN